MIVRTLREWTNTPCCHAPGRDKGDFAMSADAASSHQTPATAPPGSADPLIEARQLGRDYAGEPAVRDLGFRLHAGEVLGFLGPNGAGKSTTMRMLAGVLAPSHGEISIAGVDLLEEPLRAKRMLGYLPEVPPLYPELDVASYLRFAAELRDVAGHDLDTAVDDALERCGLGDMRHRIIGNLSKGYQQRVGIAQAIVHDPAVVILDEPTVGLDPLQINGIRDLITELGRQHTVILSTHILQEVQAVCSRVLLLHRGRLQLDRSMPRRSTAFRWSAVTGYASRPGDCRMTTASAISWAAWISSAKENRSCCCMARIPMPSPKKWSAPAGGSSSPWSLGSFEMRLPCSAQPDASLPSASR